MKNIFLFIKENLFRHSIFEINFLNNTVSSYLMFFLTFLLLFIIVLMSQKLFSKKVSENRQKIFNYINNRISPLVYYGIFYISFQNINASVTIHNIVLIVGKIIVTLTFILFLTGIFDHWFLQYLASNERYKDKISTIKAILPIVNIFFWILGIIFLLSNLGFNITAIITGLGIGGIAIALALQSIFGDLFSYLCIVFDQPFEIGDFIVINDTIMGNVEYIGIKTTRIRDLQGEEVIITNSNITGANVKNYRRMEKRRVCFSVSVTYNTTVEKLEKIPTIIKDIIVSKSDTIFERCHLKTLADSSINFETVYYVRSSDYNKYMDIHHYVNIEICKKFAEEKIEFAYPSRNIYLKDKPF